MLIRVWTARLNASKAIIKMAMVPPAAIANGRGFKGEFCSTEDVVWIGSLHWCCEACQSCNENEQDFDNKRYLWMQAEAENRDGPAIVGLCERECDVLIAPWWTMKRWIYSFEGKAPSKHK